MKKSTVIWIVCTIWMLSSCDLEGPQEECDYNARLLFHYSREGSINQIRTYVTSITDYLYDAQGRLIDVTTRKAESVPQRTFNLLPGHYTLVSWGNLANHTLVHPSSELGTEMAAMHLVQNHPYAAASATALATASATTRSFEPENVDTQQAGERLHYGRVEFAIDPVGITERTVFMGHAYLDLTVTVVGLTGVQGEAFTMQLEGAHPACSATPYQHINAQGYDMYVPEPGRQQVVAHRMDCSMNRNGELEQEFISFRLTGDSRPVFSIWQGNRQVLRNVDLKKFFDTMLINMDTNECQEFHLRITVDGDDIYVQFVTLGDWIDGGSIG